MSTVQPLDPQYADDIFAELATLEVQLDDDPLVYGPKRLNGKISLARKMTTRCERLYLAVSQQLAQYNRAFRQAELMLDLEKKNLLANDPEVRSGRAVSEREALAFGKLQEEVKAFHNAKHAVADLDAVLSVIKAKRSDLRDVQGRLRDQIRLCGEEMTLGARWGSKSPRGTELEPGQGFADGSDVEDVDDLLQSVRAISDAETHLPAEIDDTDTEDEEVAALATSMEDFEEKDVAPVVEEHEEEDVEEPLPVVPEKVAIIPAADLVEEFGFEPHCEVCGEPQMRTTSGMTCRNGHGGVGSVAPPETQLVSEPGEVEPSAAEVLPATSQKSEVDQFLSEFVVAAEKPVKPLSRREVEEADGDLDIDSILSNFSV